MSYIVPMKKPICINCPFRNLDSCTLIYLMSDKDSEVTVHVNEMTVSPDCPLVELSTPHGDLVNRQAAIAAIDKEQKEIGVSDVSAMYAYSKCKAIIKHLPPAQPKMGKWIEDKGQQILMQNFIERGEVWRVCSVCGAGHMIGHKYAIDKAYHDRHHNFCPNCGAKMEGVDDE